MLQDKLIEFQARRAQYGPLPKGTAPAIASMGFRGITDAGAEDIISMEHRWSQESRARKKSTLKAATKTADPSSIISLGTARPASIYFPWERMSMEVQDPLGSQGGGGARISMDCVREEEGYDLDIAMNYGFAAGSPQLLRFVTEHVELVHEPPYRDWSTALTCGTTSALDIVLRMLCDRGDSVLVESYTYSGMIEAARPLGVDLVEVRMDDRGLDPEALDVTLSSWNLAGRSKPKVLYTIPSGQNPTGVTQTKERREAIYAVASKHDLLIIEDDPYYFIQLGGTTNTPEEYLTSLPPSYLSLDREGRVIRLDATSKILAPGLRVGWITACSPLISKFLSFTEFSTVAPSGPSQIMLYKLLHENWRHEGFLEWLMQLSRRYTRCRDILLTACNIHLPPDLCRWTIPSCGMFLWVQVDWRSCPASKAIAAVDGRTEIVNEIEDRIYRGSIAHGVQISKGSWFTPEKPSQGDLAFRLTFAASSQSSLDEAVRRFAKAVNEELGLCVDSRTQGD